MKRWLIRIALVLVLGAAFHVITVMVYPKVVLMALSASQEKAGLRQNTLYHAPRATASSRQVVRPSPDLLYSICSYDVSQRPLLITAPVPDTYWSLSFFASNTDNFFVVNDRQLPSKQAEVLLVGPNTAPPEKGDSLVAVSPTERGVALIRMLVMDENSVADLDRIRREARCESVDR